jgi:intracellular sulfur oxidation DsrE/DsrF family protein
MVYKIQNNMNDLNFTTFSQETSRLRAKASTTCDNLTSTEVELRTCRDTLERTNVDRDSLQRQVASNLMEIDRLRQVYILVCLGCQKKKKKLVAQRL